MPSKDNNVFSIDRETGWIKAKSSYAGKFGSEFIVDVIAKDRFGEEPYFNDTAEVKASQVLGLFSPQFVVANFDLLLLFFRSFTPYTIYKFNNK